MKKLAILIVLFLFGCSRVSNEVIEKPIEPITLNPAIIKSYEVISGQIESSPIVSGNLKYIVTNRINESTLMNPEATIELWDFNTNKLEKVLYSGYYASATVINNNLYITYSKDNALYLNGRPILSGRVFNSSLTYSDRYILAVEVELSPNAPFSIVFYESEDLTTWKQCGEFNIGYSACPTIKYIDGYYYLWYLIMYQDQPHYVTNIARSKDLNQWEVSNKNFLAPDNREENNTSDVDLCEYNGITYIFYAIGNQKNHNGLTYATYNGTLASLVSYYF